MRKVGILLSVLVPVGLASVFALQGCGTSNGAPSSTSSNRAYNGSGSDWTFSVNANSTWTGTESTTSSTVSGTYTTSAKGFQILTVTSATGTNAPSAGATAWAIEAPGVAYFVKPILSTESNIIVGLNSGTCPTATADYNFTIGQATSDQDSNGANNNFFGKFTVTPGTTTSVLISSNNNLTSYTGVSGFTPQTLTGTCSAGKITIPGNNGATMYLTASGLQMIKTTSGQGILGVPMTTTTKTDMAGNYAVVLYVGGNTGSNKYMPAYMTIDATGSTGTISVLSSTDLSTATGTTATLTIGTANSPQTGQTQGTITLNGSTGKMLCTFAKSIASTTKNILSCVGQDPVNPTANPRATFQIFGISQ